MYFEALQMYGAKASTDLVVPKMVAFNMVGKFTGFKAFSVDPKMAATYGSCRAQQEVLLGMIGKDPKLFGLHSGKIGGVMALRESGVDWKSIQVRVGWAPKSPMPERYAMKAVKSLLEIDNKVAF